MNILKHVASLIALAIFFPLTVQAGNTYTICNYFGGCTSSSSEVSTTGSEQQSNETLRQGLNQVFGGGTSGTVTGAIGRTVPNQKNIQLKAESEKKRAEEITKRWLAANEASSNDMSPSEYLRLIEETPKLLSLMEYSKDSNPNHLRIWKSNNIYFKIIAGKAYFDLASIVANTIDMQKIQSVGIKSVELADNAEVAHDIALANYYYSIARSAADVLIGIDPVTGTIRAFYESITGLNMVTGEKLSSFDYGVAVFSVVTLGYTGEMVKGIEILKALVVNSDNRIAIEIAFNYAKYISSKFNEFRAGASVAEKTPTFVKFLIGSANGPRLRADYLKATFETVETGAMREYPELYRIQDAFIMNYSVGSATTKEMDAIGKAFVGEGAIVKPYPGYNGKWIYTSMDGRYVYREPVINKGTGVYQANLEVYVSPELSAGRTQPLSNAHIDIRP